MAEIIHDAFIIDRPNQRAIKTSITIDKVNPDDRILEEINDICVLLPFKEKIILNSDTSGAGPLFEGENHLSVLKPDTSLHSQN